MLGSRVSCLACSHKGLALFLRQNPNALTRQCQQPAQLRIVERHALRRRLNLHNLPGVTDAQLEVEAGHVSAAQLLGAANWILDGASLRIEVPGIGNIIRDRRSSHASAICSGVFFSSAAILSSASCGCFPEPSGPQGKKANPFFSQ